MFMLLSVEVHPGLLLVGVNFGYSHHTAAQGSGGGLDEYQTACSPTGPRYPVPGGWGCGVRFQNLTIQTYDHHFLEDPFRDLKVNAAMVGISDRRWEYVLEAKASDE